MTEDALFEFLKSELGVDTNAVEPKTSLFVSGLVDSFKMVELIAFVESKCGFRLKSRDVKLDNFDSVESILTFLSGVA